MFLLPWKRKNFRYFVICVRATLCSDDIKYGTFSERKTEKGTTDSLQNTIRQKQNLKKNPLFISFFSEVKPSFSKKPQQLWWHSFIDLNPFCVHPQNIYQIYLEKNLLLQYPKKYIIHIHKSSFRFTMKQKWLMFTKLYLYLLK